MIKIEEMPKSAQKAYKTTNAVRIVTMFLSLIAIVLFFIYNHGDFGMVDMIVGSLTLGCALHGLIHFEFIFKRFWSGIIAIGIFLLLAFCLLFTLACCAGWIFTFVDLVLFILKKPLIYPFEIKYFINSSESQAELQAAAYNEMSRPVDNLSASERISELNKMQEEGLITEDEYSRKKAEILSQL